MDVDAIDTGHDFRKTLDDCLRRCEVMLVIIGHQWLLPREGTNQSRLDDPEDLVRLEIATALKRNIVVIPVLIDGAALPEPSRLPEEIRPLAFRQSVSLRHESFARDIRSIEQDIRKISSPWRRRVVGLLMSLVIVIVLSYVVWRPGSTSPPSLAKKAAAAQQKAAPPSVLSILSPPQEQALRPKDQFRECDRCPEMVVVPAGHFTMGSPPNEPGRFSTEEPQRVVTFSKAFAVGTVAVTVGEFSFFVKETGHRFGRGCSVYEDGTWHGGPEFSYLNPGFIQDDSHPVVCVNWGDAAAYVEWLSRKTGKRYRLLTEAEREYVTRAGTGGSFWWGSSISTTQANYNGYYIYKNGGDPEKMEYRRKAVPAKSFDPNPWGLYQVHGNVLEWLEDFWVIAHPLRRFDSGVWR